MSKVLLSRSEPPRGLGRDRTIQNDALNNRRFPKIIRVAWLTLGITSVALASMAALVLRSERKSTAILQHLNVASLNLQHVLSDLAEAETEQREYLLTGRGSSLENFARSNKALALEFDQLTALVKNNPAERQEVERVRSLVEQNLDELRKSIASRTATEPQVALAEIQKDTDRAAKLTEAFRQSITRDRRGATKHAGPARTATEGSAVERPGGYVWRPALSGLLPPDRPDHNRPQRIAPPKNGRSVARE
jgi:CHASE3 domain sensor protein